jgi:hypothetical protein
MNERNVAALRDALQQLFPLDIEDDDPVGFVARELASRGVLVPDALTPEECDDVFDEAMHIYHLDGPNPEVEHPRLTGPTGYAWDWECGPMIVALERIAKGEP